MPRAPNGDSEGWVASKAAFRATTVGVRMRKTRVAASMAALHTASTRGMEPKILPQAAEVAFLTEVSLAVVGQHSVAQGHPAAQLGEAGSSSKGVAG